MEAFFAAREAGFEHFETDIRTSKDGQLVLCHDQTFERLGGPRVAVSDLSAKAIAKIRLADGQNPALWESLMEEFGDHRWTFDVKPEQGERAVRFLSNHIKTNGWVDRVDSGQYRFLFWNRHQQHRFIENFPTAHCYARKEECKKVGFAFLARFGWLIRPKAGVVYAVPQNFKGKNLFNRSTADHFHRYGARILAYLPDSVDAAQSAEAAGFDEVLVDFPVSVSE